MAPVAELVRPVLLAAGALLMLLLGGARCAAGELTFRDPAGRPLDLAEVALRLRDARFVLIGEEHGNYRHHDVQVRILAALRDAGVPLATGLEAFPPAATPALARWVKGELDSAPLYRMFGSAWSTRHWPAYRDLLFFLRDRRIPAVGINAEEYLVRRVAREGYASLSAEEQGRLPAGGCVANERYRSVLERIMTDDARGPGHMRNLCEAQSLRDALLSRELVSLANARPGRLIAGLTGLYHAWKPAVPARLAELGAGRVVVILPEEGLPGTVQDLAPEADFLWRWRD